MSRISEVMVGLMPVILMVVLQVTHAAVSILFKLVANEGRSLSVLMAYRYIFASIFMVPLAFFVERKSKPKITATVLFQAFLCGFFGASLQQNLFVKAIALAGATYPTAMYNLIPGFTFLFAVFFGLERLKIRTRAGKAKVVGTVMGIGGAMMLTFYKRHEIRLWSTHVNLMRHSPPSNVPASATHIWGSSLALGTAISYAIWLIIQAKMSQNFPWQYTSAALMSVMAAIQSLIFALFMERNHWTRWKLGWDITLLTAIYTGVVSSGISWTLITWCVRLKGPLFAASFNPLFLLLVAIAGSLLLDERLHLGSIIGLIFVVLGLYIVLWGNATELKLTKGSLEEVEAPKIITTDQAHGTVSSFFIESEEGKGQISTVENVSANGTEENKILKISTHHQIKNRKGSE